jgi:hypothetical protein
LTSQTVSHCSGPIWSKLDLIVCTMLYVLDFRLTVSDDIWTEPACACADAAPAEAASPEGDSVATSTAPAQAAAAARIAAAEAR